MGTMKIIYEFDPYEDREELEAIQNVRRMQRALSNALEKIRGTLKHGTPGQELMDYLEMLRAEIRDDLGDYDP
jgi:hypothetical protein